MSFLGISGKTFLVVGFANKKSIAWSVAQLLREEGARVLYCVRNQKRKEELLGLIGSGCVLTCDFREAAQIERLGRSISKETEEPLSGVLHSIAFANYADGPKPFHETNREDFLQATQVSSFSLVEFCLFRSRRVVESRS